MSDSQDRCVLEHVPLLHFYQGGPACPEDIPFPSAMRALMEYLGDEDLGCQTCRGLRAGCRVGCTYAHFMGVTGVAAFLNWKPGWEGDNVEIMYMSDDPGAPFRRAFQAAGLEGRYLGHEKGVSRQRVRDEIVQSIRKGLPVLAFGPIGPPESALVCGYDQGGDVLLGWSFFQDVPPFNQGVQIDTTGMFRCQDWHEYPPGFSVFIFGERQPRPALRDTYREALRWMVQVSRTPKTFGNRANGLAAYDAWAAQLAQEEDFPEDETVRRSRHDVHNNVVGTLAEARWYGAAFLMQTTLGEGLPHPAIADLLHAAGCHAEIRTLMWMLWDLAGGNGNPEAWKQFAKPEVRAQMVSVLGEARRQDELATQHLEQALAGAG